jgi:hypothetical protein
MNERPTLSIVDLISRYPEKFVEIVFIVVLVNPRFMKGRLVRGKIAVIRVEGL